MGRFQLAHRGGQVYARLRATAYRPIRPYPEGTKPNQEHELNCLTRTISRPAHTSNPISPISCEFTFECSPKLRHGNSFPPNLSHLDTGVDASKNTGTCGATCRLYQTHPERAKPNPEQELNCLTETVSRPAPRSARARRGAMPRQVLGASAACKSSRKLDIPSPFSTTAAYCLPPAVSVAAITPPVMPLALSESLNATTSFATIWFNCCR